MTRSSRVGLLSTVVALAATLLVGTAGAQHDPASNGHLLGPPGGTWGNLELVSTLRVSDATNDLVADHAILGNYAYVAKWGAPDCAGPETGGQTSPDGGVYVIDISNLSSPKEVGFIATRQDTLVGEGMQALPVTTAFFSGDMLAVNHEACGKNGRGGFSLWDITSPLKPRKLTELAGDHTIDDRPTHPHAANEYHSVFVWDTGPNAYLVATDDLEANDVDIFDITDPRRPVLLAEPDLNQYGVSQPELGLTDSFLHDMVVKQIGSKWVMVLSYWDGGYVLLDVSNPASPAFLGDSDYPAVDPQLLESTGVSLTPEGNGHQAEVTVDNRFVVATDEDFDPYRGVITTPDGSFRAGIGSNTDPSDLVDISGATTFVGRACDGDTQPPGAPSTGTQIAVVERGLCTFEEKAQNVIAAGGWDALLIMNREGADACTGVFSPSLGAPIRTMFVGRDVGFAMFGVTYSQTACADATPQLAPIAFGAPGDPVQDFEIVFDGWGYIHLYGLNTSAWTLTELDTFAIPEAMDEAYAVGFGALSVHEVATDPSDADRVYSSYYMGGIRALEIQCVGPSSCELVETGGYLDPDTDGAGPDRGGNEFWGIETFTRGGETYVSGSDMDAGLVILRVKP